MNSREPLSKTSTMAEGNRQEEGYGAWFGGLLAAAKEKSEKALEMVSNDLAEFTCTMQKDTKKVVEQTKETLKNEETKKTTTDKLKTGFHYFMDGLTKALTVEPEDTSPPKPQPTQPDDNVFDRAKSRLRAIQVDTGTYIHEPSGPPEQFASWLKSFDIDSKKGDISELLISMVEVRSLYATLVPSQVSHQEFWQRYFYKVHQLELDEARKQALMKRADKAETKEDSLGWDDEDWSADEDQVTVRNNSEEIENRLKPDVDSKADLQNQEGPNSSQSNTNDQSDHRDKTVLSLQDEILETQSKTVEKVNTNIGRTTTEDSEKQSENVIDKEAKAEIKSEVIKSVEKVDESDKVTGEEKELSESKKSSEGDSEVVQESSRVPKDDKSCDNQEKVVMDQDEGDLKTKVKGDMVVVGTERISPSSDLSGNKESSSEDWEQDFDIELTEEDIKAAEEVARKLNVSATDYTKLTGDQDDDWENWE